MWSSQHVLQVIPTVRLPEVSWLTCSDLGRVFVFHPLKLELFFFLLQVVLSCCTILSDLCAAGGADEEEDVWSGLSCLCCLVEGGQRSSYLQHMDMERVESSKVLEYDAGNFWNSVKPGRKN